MSLGEPPASLAILVTGGTGQVGFELVRELSPLGVVHAPTRAELDLTDERALRRYLRTLNPALIVNAAAYTAVDAAETDAARARLVNDIAPGVLASHAAEAGGGLIHYSTDYVFDGMKAAAYLEDDIPNPLSVYGHTKLAGERAIEAAGGAAIIFRTSWVYGQRGRNFLRTMLSLAREREELRVVDDQVGAPTWSRLIAAATALVIARLRGQGPLTAQMDRVKGIYHLTAPDVTSWHGLAESILALDPLAHEHRCSALHGISSGEYPVAARRPANSRLDSTKASAALGVSLPPWREQLVLAMRSCA